MKEKEINIGDTIRYTFPNPNKGEKKYIIGKVEQIGEFHLVIKTDKNVNLKINFKNFEHISNLTSVIKKIDAIK